MIIEGNMASSSNRAAQGTTALLPTVSEPSGPFQARVEPWMRECFGDVIPFDKVERGDRLIEEVYELLQWAGYDRQRLASLEDYVWNRPVGEGPQEVGGVMVTLAAFCLAHKLDMHAAGETELARIWTKVPQIRAKQAAKPTGSALPIAPAGPIGVSIQAREDQKPDREAIARIIDPFAWIPGNRRALGVAELQILALSKADQIIALHTQLGEGEEGFLKRQIEAPSGLAHHGEG